MTKPGFPDEYKLERLVTGLHSFDRAFNKNLLPLGIPIGKGWELMGRTFVGKTTIALSLAGIIAKHTQGNIVLADLEGFNSEHVISILEHQQFDGNVYPIYKEMDEDVLTEIPILLRDEEINATVGILDSIAALSSIAEREGTAGEANWGKRAKLMATFSRKLLPLVRGKNKTTILMTNHYYPPASGRGGWKSPGGEVKGYLCSVAIVFTKLRKYMFPDGSFAVEGKVTKNRWGGISEETKTSGNTTKVVNNNIFHLFIKADEGIHHGLTAVLDCRMKKVATVYKKVIKIGDNKIGKWLEMIEQSDTFDFTPFYEALKENNEKTVEDN